MVELSQLLTLLKQYGPVVAVLLFVIWWQSRQINRLLDRNSTIYEGHIRTLWETQDRLLTKLIGPQPSSHISPTIQDIKAEIAQADGGKTAQDAKGGN